MKFALLYLGALIGWGLLSVVLVQSLKCLHDGASLELPAALSPPAHSHVNWVQVPFLTKMHGLSITLTGFTAFYSFIYLFLLLCSFLFLYVFYLSIYTSV